MSYEFTVVSPIIYWGGQCETGSHLKLGRCVLVQEDDAPAFLDLDEASEEQPALRGEITALKQEVTTLKQQIADRDSEIHLLKEEVATRNQHIRDLTQMLDLMRDKVRSLEQDLYRVAQLTSYFQSAFEIGLEDFLAGIKNCPSSQFQSAFEASLTSFLQSIRRLPPPDDLLTLP